MTQTDIPPKNNRILTADGLIAMGCSLVALLLYRVTLAPTVLPADPGEFQFVAWLPGIAHPTGYPLYTLLGWLWSHLLPFGEVAWRMNLLSAVLAALAVGLLYLLSRQLLLNVLSEVPLPAHRLAALLTALSFAVTPTFWSQALIAEVYSLHAVFVSLLLLLLLIYRQPTRLTSLIFGLSLTHHSTTMLILPPMLLFYWLERANFRLSAPLMVQHLLCLLAPLSLYLYLPLIAPFTPYATITLTPDHHLVLYENTLSGFIQHITATVFTGELRPTAVGLERLALVGTWLHQQVGWLGVALAGGGLLSLINRRAWATVALTGLTFLTISSFNLIYFIGDVYVLFIPAWLLVCLWAGLGAVSLTHQLASRFVQGRMTANINLNFRAFEQRLARNIYRLLVSGFLLPFFLWPLWLASSYYTPLDQSENTAARDRWQQILAEPLPERAILLSNDRNEIMPLWYYQYVAEMRPDLQGLFPLIVPEPEYLNIGRLLEQALATERPVYLIKPMPGLTLKANLQPQGTLFRATALDLTPAQPLPDISMRHPHRAEKIALRGYQLEQSAAGLLQVALFWQPQTPLQADYTSYVHLLDATGQPLSQSDHQPGAPFYPPSMWQPGEQLRDQHDLPWPTEEFMLRVGLYEQPIPGQFINFAEGQLFGPLTLPMKE